MDDLQQGANQIIGRIGLPEDFLKDLLKSDDWTFVVKIAALMEAVLTHTILENLGRNELEVFVKKLSYQNKLQMVVSIGLLPEYVKFFRLIAELRNTVVHNIELTNFSLEAHFSNSEFFAKLANSLPELKKEDVGNIQSIKAKKPQNAKVSKTIIWMCVLGSLAMAYSHVKHDEFSRRMADLYQNKGKNVGFGLGDKALLDELFCEEN